MKLFFLRHGMAEDAVDEQYDEDRALTPAGRAQLEQVARAMRRLDVKPDIILSSPLLRARETAEIVGPVVDAAVNLVSELQPGCQLTDLLRLLGRYPQDTIMIVGHQPDLSALAARLINADERGLVLKKAGLIRVDIAGRPQAGRGRLVGLLTPKMLLLMAGEPHPDNVDEPPHEPTGATSAEIERETPKEPTDVHDYGT